MTGPLVPDVGVIALVPDVWGSHWQPRQQIMTRLSRFFPVVWVDPPRGWREAWSTRSSRPRIFDPTMPAETAFRVYRPGRLLPLVFRPRVIGRLLARLRLRRAIALLRSRGARRIVCYIWRPELGDALDHASFDVTCYHIDDEYSFSPVELPLDPRESALIRRVDQVIIHSVALLEKKGRLNAHTDYVPNGVDFDAFAAPHEEPEDLRGIPHPRIGYTGVVKHQLDLQLVIDLATRHPEWSFVLVGPCRNVRPDVLAELNARANVHLLGNKPVSALPHYAQHMDVNIMPYVQDGYTKFIYPLKLHEYLASGRPAVATPIRSLHEFAGVVALADTAAEWDAALTRALGPEARDPRAVSQRRAVARAHDWSVLTERIAKLIASRVGPDILARLDSAGTDVRATPAVSRSA